METDLMGRLRTIESEQIALKKLAVGQTAMIALLSALLTSKGVLTKEESVLIATSGIDTQDYEGLTPGDIGTWLKDQLEALKR